jgi:hypothetical protein
MAAETGQSTSTRSRLRRRVEQLLAAEHGCGAAAIDGGVRPSGRRDERRPAASARRPPGAVKRTGRHGRSPVPSRSVRASWCKIDTSPLDVMALLDDGVTGWMELTVVLDAVRAVRVGLAALAGGEH